MQVHTHLSLLTLLAVAASLTTNEASAQCMSDRFWSSNGTGGDIFGRSLDVSGDTLLVGASRTDRNGSNSVGSVYRFERTPSGFVEAEEWNAFDASQQDEFGEDLDIDGNWAVVGARWADVNGSNSGAVYLWERVAGTWVAGPKLSGSQTDADDLFGCAVGISDGSTPRLAVGAYWHGHVGTGAPTGGAVYIYEYDTDAFQWAETQILRSNDIAVGDFFGQVLDFDGERLIVGAPSEDDGGSSAGATYVFEHNGTGFVQTAKILASDIGVFDSFGRKLALDGDQIAVTGRRAYVFELQAGTWTETAIITGSGISGGWGDSIDLAGDRMVVTKYFFGTGGGAWYFERSGGVWSEVGLTNEQSAGDYYGRNCFIDGDSVLVSADSANTAGTSLTAGEVYSYPLAGSDCNANGTADACEIFSGTSADANLDGVPDECAGGAQSYCSSTPNSTGSAAVISMTGSTSVAANDFTLHAGPVPNQPGLFFYSVNQADFAFGNGRVCVGGPQVRLAVVSPTANQSSYAYDLTQWPQGGEISAGSTWNFQLWFRDPTLGAGFDLSDAISVPFTP